MNGEKKGLLLQTTKQINIGAGISGVGFLLYLAASALKIQLAADVISIIFAIVAVWTFLSAASGRRRSKEAVSYSLLRGTGALTILLVACVALTLKVRFSL